MSLTSTFNQTNGQAQPVYIKPVQRAIIGLNQSGGTQNPAAGGTVAGTGDLASVPITSQENLQPTVIMADAVVEEESDDELIVTEQPVEQGAVISDHAYKMPSKLGLLYGWITASSQNTTQDASFLSALYQKVLGLQVNRIPCNVVTGKRMYRNMLITRIRQKTDKENENILLLSIEMTEVLVATTQLVPIATADQQQYPAQTAQPTNQGNQSLQSAPNFNYGASP